MYERVLRKQPPEMFFKVFLEILQNSQENTCARDSFFMWILRNFLEHHFYITVQATAYGAESASV